MPTSFGDKSPARPIPKRFILLGIVLVFAALAFSPSWQNGFVSDDNGLIPNRISLYQDVAGLKELVRHVYWWGSGDTDARYDLYRPLVSATFWFDYQLGGDDPRVYHVSNYLVHLANTLLVYLCLVPIAGSGLALAVAALFGVGPAAVTSVGWISGRTDLWAAFFSLLFIWLFGLAARRNSRGAAVGAWGSLFLALMSKEAAIVAPLIAWALQRGSVAGERASSRGVQGWSRYLWLAIPVAGYLLVRWLAVGVLVSRSLKTDRLPYVAEQLIRSAIDIVIPVHYRFFSMFWWSNPGARGIGFVLVWLALAALVAAIVVGLWRRRLWAAGGLWFGVALAPVYLAGQSWKPISDFYAYLAIAGLWLFVLGGLGSVLRKPAARWKHSANVAGIAVGVVVVLFGVLTFLRVPILRSQFTLAEHMARREPHTPAALMSLGEEYFSAGNAGRGEEWMMRAASLDTTAIAPWKNCAQYYLAQNDVRKAAPFVDRLAEIGTNSSDAQAVIAHFYYKAGHCTEAVQTYQRSMRLAYPTASTLYDYGLALLCIGQNSLAVEAYRLALAHRPFWPAAYSNLGVAYESMGSLAEAIGAYETAVRQDPALATTWESLALLHLQMGRLPDAERAAANFFALNPPQERVAKLHEAISQTRGAAVP
ncbi:MAG: tetratricopeptide repeat protein [bacterium]|nr:tetratricopeptide repeat protein [bacterium]